METFDAAQIVGTIGYIILLIGLVICGPAFVFFWKNNVQPIRARSPWMYLTMYICYFGVSAGYEYDVFHGEGCMQGVWMQPIFGQGLEFAYLVRTFRLLWIFNLTKYKLDDNHQGLIDSKWKFWRHESIVREDNIFKVWLAVYLAFFIFPIGATVQSEVQRETCVPIIEQVGSGIGNVFILVMFITVAVKLAKVHDGYFLKGEFKALGIIVLCYGVPLVVTNLIIPGPTKYWVPAGSQWLLVFTSICSFWIPCYKAYRTYADDKYNSSSEMSGSSVHPNDSRSEEQSASYEIFPSSHKVAKLLKDQLSYKYIQEYLLHYQDMRMSAYLLFWQQIYAFKAIKEKQQLTGKAYLLFQKYLVQNAYRFIDCCPNTLTQKMEQELAAATSENATTEISNTFFDEVLAIAENVMLDELFTPFFASDFFKTYKEASRLQVGIEVVST